MTDSSLSQVVTIFMSQSFLIFFVYLLADFRQPVRKWRAIWAACAGVITAVNLALVVVKGYDFYMRFYPLTMTVWHVGVIMIASRHRGASILFNILTVFNIAFAAGLVGFSAQALAGDFPWIDCLGRLTAYLLLSVLVYKIRTPYLRMLSLLKRGWPLLCAFPLTTAIFFYILMRTKEVNEATLFLIGFAIVLLALFYSVVWLFFRRVMDEDEAKRDSDLLKIQVSSMRDRLEATKAAEELIRIERHDLKHRLQTVATLVEKRDEKEALNYISAAKARLDERIPAKVCLNPVLDAVISSYIAQAEAEGIKVELSLSLPDELPVDALELSTVFANALDNAIVGCKALPEGKRRLKCKCVCVPSLMLEIANTCDETARFDKNQRPISTEANHGVGTRSIAAFVEKYNAWCAYEMKNGWFRLQIAL